jgi:hypothetical protein
MLVVGDILEVWDMLDLLVHKVLPAHRGLSGLLAVVDSQDQPVPKARWDSQVVEDTLAALDIQEVRVLRLDTLVVRAQQVHKVK